MIKAAINPIAMKAPMLSKVPATGPAKIAPPIIPNLIYCAPILPLNKIENAEVHNTDEDSENNMFWNASGQTYLLSGDFIG